MYTNYSKLKYKYPVCVSKMQMQIGNVFDDKIINNTSIAIKHITFQTMFCSLKYILKLCKGVS